LISDKDRSSWDKKDQKWRAQVQIHRKGINLGSFNDKEEAGLTWDAAAKLAWTPRFQWLNFLDCFSNHIVLPPRIIRKIEAALAQPELELAEAA